MRKEDLIKKLEKIKLPQIEVPSHKNRLKMTLIDWKHHRERGVGEFFAGLKRILIPLGTVAVILIAILVVGNLIGPQDALAEVKEIAMKDPQIKEWIEGGAKIKDIKITNNKAYILIAPTEISEREAAVETIKTEGRKFNGALAEIAIKEKKVSKVEEIVSNVIPLTSREEEKAKKLIRNLEISEKSTGAIEIEKIEPLPSYQLKLMEKNGGIEILPEEKEEDRKTSIIYRVGGVKRKGLLNLTEEKVENLKILEEEEEPNKMKELE